MSMNNLSIYDPIHHNIDIYIYIFYNSTGQIQQFY